MPREAYGRATELRGRRSKQPKNSHAYELYLRGRHEWYVPFGAGATPLRRAIRYFASAISADSTFADAYAGLATSYVVLGTGTSNDFSPGVVADSARHAAQKALLLNDSLPEAHLALGYVHLLYDFDWNAATKELRIAREINPYYSRTPLWPSVLYEWKGQFSEAIGEAANTLRTDPFSAMAMVEYARALFFAGRYTEAKAALQRASAVDSTADRLNLTAGEIYLHEGRYPQALAEFERFAKLTRESSRALAFVAFATARMGDSSRTRTILAELVRRRNAGTATAFDLAVVYAGRKDSDQGFLWMNRAYEDHSIRPLMMDPTFADLQRDPRFNQLLRRMKLRN